jgi:serralysin
MYLKKDSIDQDGIVLNSNLEPNQNQWCFSYFACSELANFNEKAAMLLQAQWNVGDIISISFLDGEKDIRKRVEEVAKEWVSPGMANLKFQFREDTNDTDIRISFRSPGSWSALGTTCKNVAKDKQTMNLGWLDDDSTDSELYRTVLHEFGHALGLIHEHMSPADGRIQWNEEQVIRDLSGPPNNWSKSVIFNNMFKTFDEDALRTSHLDCESIMMYPIPAKWTLNGFNVGLNTKLSELDKKFIKETYPGNNP